MSSLNEMKRVYHQPQATGHDEQQNVGTKDASDLIAKQSSVYFRNINSSSRIVCESVSKVGNFSRITPCLTGLDILAVAAVSSEHCQNESQSDQILSRSLNNSRSSNLMQNKRKVNHLRKDSTSTTITDDEMDDSSEGEKTNSKNKKMRIYSKNKKMKQANPMKVYPSPRGTGMKTNYGTMPFVSEFFLFTRLHVFLRFTLI
mmetsp:Transcript_41754/g.97775  ORF Transcript_41754/g.97775 Transcript_41754/m.97775 type:complete len:202 (+) Transcript_41754:212-817(+)